MKFILSCSSLFLVAKISGSFAAPNQCSPVPVNFPSETITKAISTLLGSTNLYDGPTSVSAKKASTKNSFVAEADLRYYNYYTAAVYCPVGLEDLSCCPCGNFKADVDSHEIIDNQVAGTRALLTVSKKRKEIAVAYRGSQMAQNFLQDLTLTKMSIKGVPKSVKVHKGFYDATMSIHPKIVKKLKALRKKYKNYKIFVIGHSLGASMAAISMMLLVSQKSLRGAKLQLISYACPRTGNAGFADYMNSLGIPATRVSANADIATHIPPVDTMGLAGDYYIHFIPAVWAKKQTSVQCKTNVYEDPNCSNSLDPSYVPQDHLQYWELTYLQCFNTSTAALANTLLGLTSDTLSLVNSTVGSVTSAVSGATNAGSKKGGGKRKGRKGIFKGRKQ